MHSFISFFKKSPAFTLAVLFIVLFETVLHFVPNLYYLDGRGSFFTYYKRFLAEDSSRSYDILIYGDSRSLSLQGQKKNDKNKYSIYNFSLPAAGPRYFPFFLKKYLKNHSEKPKLVVWAADPALMMSKKTVSFSDNPALWNEYKHRLLNLFSISEAWEQYSGTEFFFIMKEYLPHSLLTVRHRQGFESLVGIRLESLLAGKFHLVEENKRLIKFVEDENGKINLGDFFPAPEGASEKEIEKHLPVYNTSEINTEPLRNFLDLCRKENLKVIVLNIPRAEGFHKTLFYRTAETEIKKLLLSYPEFRYVQFENMDYPLNLFSESIHYNFKGGKRVNAEYTEKIIPQFYSYIENHEK